MTIYIPDLSLHPLDLIVTIVVRQNVSNHMADREPSRNEVQGAMIPLDCDFDHPQSDVLVSQRFHKSVLTLITRILGGSLSVQDLPLCIRPHSRSYFPQYKRHRRYDSQIRPNCVPWVTNVKNQVRRRVIK